MYNKHGIFGSYKIKFIHFYRMLKFTDNIVVSCLIFRGQNMEIIILEVYQGKIVEKLQAKIVSF